MKTIATVAIAALNKFSEELSSPSSVTKYHAMWLAWMQMRLAAGYLDSTDFHFWQESIQNDVRLLKESYTKGDSYQKKLRNQFLESANLRLTVNVMGGFKGEYCQWETECFVSIVA